jgi:hypothetical protein
VTLRARWVTLRARWVTPRARWVTLRARVGLRTQISTRIEVYVGMPGPGGAPAQMKRLGYLSFASNEGSDFKARELKSVHVSTPAQLLRLVFHKCHINKLNIYNQVGARSMLLTPERTGECQWDCLAALEALGRGNRGNRPHQTRPLGRSVQRELKRPAGCFETRHGRVLGHQQLSQGSSTHSHQVGTSDAKVANRTARGDRKRPPSDRYISQNCVKKVALGTGYNPGEGNGGRRELISRLNFAFAVLPGGRGCGERDRRPDGRQPGGRQPTTRAGQRRE